MKTYQQQMHQQPSDLILRAMLQEIGFFSSGQIPVDPATGEVAGPDIAAQAEQSCKNVKAVIEAIAGGYNDMKFYSYEYLLSRIEATNWLQIFFAAVVVLLLLFALIMSFRDKKTTKYMYRPPKVRPKILTIGGRYFYG